LALVARLDDFEQSLPVDFRCRGGLAGFLLAAGVLAGWPGEDDSGLDVEGLAPEGFAVAVFEVEGFDVEDFDVEGLAGLRACPG
jgi:hypothetical protein